MAILFADPVSQYTTPFLLALWTQFTSASTISPIEPRVVAGIGPRDGSVLECATTSGTVGSNPPMGLEKVLAPTGNTAIVGCSFKAGIGTTGGTGFTPLVTQASGGNSINMVAAGFGVNDKVINMMMAIKNSYYTQVALTINTNGTISALTGNANSFVAPFTGMDRIGVVLGTTSNALLFDAWYSIELKVLTHASAGTVQLWVNNDLWLNLSGIKTIAQGASAVVGWSSFQLGAPMSAPFIDYRYADVRALDTNTADPFNDLADKIGPAAIDPTMPNADGFYTQWTPKSAGTHFSEVDEIPPDDDTTYNETDVVNEIDSFTTPGVPITGVGIIAVGVMGDFKSIDGGASSTQLGLRIGGTDYLIGAAVGNTGSYTYQQAFVNDKPSDGLPFSEAQFAAAQPFYKKMA